MAKEMIYYCDNCGKINDRNVVWGTLQGSVEMSFCPNCMVQINRRLVDKGKVPVLDIGIVKNINKDLFNKYGGTH